LTGPDPSTPRSATIATANSARLKRQMCRNAWISTRLMTAASTIAASTGWGRFRSSPDANSTTIRVKTAAIRPESGVRAPALSFTSDCDMPPLTGKPRPSAATRLPAPTARISWFASNRCPCFCPNIRPIADVSTADRTKQAMAMGRSPLTSWRLSAGSPSAGKPCGTSPSSATPCA
jgi:hypothetical protein